MEIFIGLLVVGIVISLFKKLFKLAVGIAIIAIAIYLYQNGSLPVNTLVLPIW